ncbi:MAG: PD-(D/E)XK nuclease family transposase, partial [Treponema sp.]|nr:PD-(D/E)XK nuclease family transposase [Treponema sp.]
RRVYQIFFLNFELFPGSNKIPRRYGYREEIEHDLLTDTSEIIFYELPKLEKRVTDYFEGKIDTETLSAEEKWCIFLKYRHEHGMEPLIKELCFREEGIMRADKEVKKHDRSWLKYMRNVSREKDRIDERYRNIAAYKRGCEEEREKAHQEKLSIARNALAEGLTPEFIQKITGLSLDEIAKL